MPDAAGIVARAADGLQLGRDARALEMPITDRPADTTHAAAALRERGAACIVVLGGDGTCRAAAKGAGDVPLLPVSTGTNNAFPQFIEGTLVGLAAAVDRACLMYCSTAALRLMTQAPCLRVLREDQPSIWRWSTS